MDLATAYVCTVLIVVCVLIPIFAAILPRADRAAGARLAWQVAAGLGVGGLGMKAWIGVELRRLLASDAIGPSGELLGEYAVVSASASIAFVTAAAIGGYAHHARVRLPYANPVLNFVLGAVALQGLILWVALVLNPDSPHGYDLRDHLSLYDARDTYVRGAIGLAIVTTLLFVGALYGASKRAAPPGAGVSRRPTPGGPS